MAQAEVDADAQYASPALTERLAALRMRASIGTVADAYDNALAQSTIGLFKTEPIHRRGPWRSLDDIEIATLEWIDWFDNRACTPSSAASHPPSTRPTTARGLPHPGPPPSRRVLPRFSIDTPV